jgi:hypothetical protein
VLTACYKADRRAWCNLPVTVNSATRNARAGLWEKATELPAARESDFFGQHRRPLGVDAEYLKIINDTSLRTRLIDSGIAEGLQSPKGPQRIPSIIRLYPNFDAPGKDAATRPGRTTEVSRAAYGLPTVEELTALLDRIRDAEATVSAELQHQVNADIGRLKRQIGDLDGDEFDRVFNELDRAIGKRKSLGKQVREAAFRQIEADAAFPGRKYLRLISREPPG